PAPCDNIPTITDATPAYDAILGSSATNVPEFPAASLIIAATALVAGAGIALQRRRSIARHRR
ncbi:MAG: hypothetical protein ABR498_05105, partial [Candidatus Dormibacteria bacterium]